MRNDTRELLRGFFAPANAALATLLTHKCRRVPLWRDMSAFDKPSPVDAVHSAIEEALGGGVGGGSGGEGDAGAAGGGQARRLPGGLIELGQEALVSGRWLLDESRSAFRREFL